MTKIMRAVVEGSDEDAKRGSAPARITAILIERKLRPLPNELLRFVRAPAGMPLLFGDKGDFLHAPHLFLLALVRRRGGLHRMSCTLAAYADDLRTWWAFLQENDLRWDVVDAPTLHDFVALVTNEISPVTGRRYAEATVYRRVHTVLRFYRFATTKGLARVDADLINSKPTDFVNADALALAHAMRRAPRQRTVVQLREPDASEHVNIITPDQLKLILNRLGPNLAAGVFPPDVSIRDRLAAEWAVFTGMRNKEVLGLTKAQVLGAAIGCESFSPSKLVKLRLVATKGDRKRDALVPMFLLRASAHYIDSERAEALRKARAHNDRYREPPQLFLNGIDTNIRYVGKRMQGKVLSGYFSRAVRACGYLDELQTSKGVRKVPKFRFHDLRHTFAVRTYNALEAAGKREPWKTVQVLLGHKRLSTTMDIYLKHVRIDEALLGDALSDHIKRLVEDVRLLPCE